MGSVDRDVEDLAGRQHGVVSLTQLSELGCTRARLRRLVAAGTLERVGARVYALCGSATTFERQLTAGLLGLGSTAVVSHLAAARLHGLVDEAGPEFTVPRSRRNATGAFTIHATDALCVEDRCAVGGFPCTSVIRTVMDVAAIGIGVDRLREVVARAGRPGELRRALQQRRGRGTAGVSRLDAVLRDHTSIVERRFLSALRDQGLPRPVRVPGREEPTFQFVGTGLTVTVRPTACNWPAIARALHQALRDAGWSGDPELRPVA